MPGTNTDVRGLGGFVWSIAEILRGDFKQSEYGKVILPFIVLRRLDCLLDASKQDVLKAAKGLSDAVDDPTKDMILFAAAGENIKVYNLSAFTFESLKAQDPGQLHDNLIDYITKFSGNVRDIFLDKFLFTEQLKRLNEGGILWQVFDRFTQIDLHPERVGNIEMGYLFEDLIRRFSEISNETAGEHFTPREVIRLIVELLIANDDTNLTGKGIIRQVYDPACGTGGMLALTEQALKEFNPSIRVELFGQELNGESFGICKSDMLVTGHDPEQIAFGNTLTNDAHKGKSFHYMLSNPPYGVDWKKYQDPIREEAQTLGTEGRFGAGLPRISDGQLLFLQHMISKMRDDETGSRIGIVMNGSPLFTGGANSGESEIRRWMLENDWVEADRRPADRPVLQHRHPDLCVVADQPQTDASTREGAVDRRLGRAILASPCASPSAPSGAKFRKRRAGRSSASMRKCWTATVSMAKSPRPSIPPTSATGKSASSGPCG